MEKTIKELKAICKCDRFIVTGSYALHLMGLVKQVKDLDIILVNPSEETKERMTELQNVFPAKTKARGKGPLHAIFITKDNTKVDVFIKPSFEETTISTPNYEIARADWIFAAKKNFARIKDWLQLRKIAATIFNEKEFTKWMDNTPPEYAHLGSGYPAEEVTLTHTPKK